MVHSDFGNESKQNIYKSKILIESFTYKIVQIIAKTGMTPHLQRVCSKTPKCVHETGEGIDGICAMTASASGSDFLRAGVPPGRGYSATKIGTSTFEAKRAASHGFKVCSMKLSSSFPFQVGGWIALQGSFRMFFSGESLTNKTSSKEANPAQCLE